MPAGYNPLQHAAPLTGGLYIISYRQLVWSRHAFLKGITSKEKVDRSWYGGRSFLIYLRPPNQDMEVSFLGPTSSILISNKCWGRGKRNFHTCPPSLPVLRHQHDMKQRHPEVSLVVLGLRTGRRTVFTHGHY